MPSRGFENITELFNPKERIIFNSQGTDYDVSYEQLQNILKSKKPEEIIEFIDNAEYNKEYNFMFEVLKSNAIK